MIPEARSLRLLFVSNYYPPYEIGGYEQLCRDVAEALCTAATKC